MNGIDFIAKLDFLTTKQGGRKNHVITGYRPHIEFENYSEYLTSGQQTYIGQETVHLGEQVKAEIAILSKEYFSKRLYEDMTFKFSEGPHTVGYGKIVLNENWTSLSIPKGKSKEYNKEKFSKPKRNEHFTDDL